MQFIDTHLHLWDLDQQINSWVINSNDSRLGQNYLPCDYFKWVGNSLPDGFITIEAADGSKTLQEVKWLSEILKSYSGQIKHRHIAYIDTTQPSDLFARQLELFKQYSFVAGFRDIGAYSKTASYSPCSEDITLNPDKMINLGKNLKLLQQNNYIYNCQMYPEQLLQIYPEIIESKIKCIIDHGGLPIINCQESYALWQQMLSKYSGSEVYFKLSGLDINNNWDKRNLVFDTIISKIPVERLVYGSNFPLLQKDWLNELATLLKHENYLTTEIEKILLTNAIKLFQL